MSKPKPLAYVVFFGHEVDVFCDWSRVKDRIASYHGPYQCGFPSVQAAKAALAYARSQGWTADSMLTQVEPPLPLPSLYEPNTLNSGSVRQWYVVSSGIHPGIYSSGMPTHSLECHLNIACVQKVPNSIHSAHFPDASNAKMSQLGDYEHSAYWA
ncbi:hypothetical protein FB451DRAFT_1375469 [Mycena latifolia]|nr:hypothetical protein FB451DRAFT_1375469 [Mycena latifolia]